MTTVAKIQELALPKTENAKTIVLAGLSILAVMVGMYVYFVGKIVFDVVGRSAAESSIRSLQSSLSTNSMAYLEGMKSVDLASAAGLGLTTSTDMLYATRTADTGAAAVGMVYNH